MHGSLNRWSLGTISLLLVLASVAGASTPSATALMDEMKAALEPAQSSIRTMRFTVHSASFNENTEMGVEQARKRFPDGARSVTIVTSPESLRGVALLVIEQKGKPNLEYVYYPAMRRARNLTGAGFFESFLGTDFTYADLGLIDVHQRSLKVLGTKQVGDRSVYQLEETPMHAGYYSRIVDWVSVSSGLPLERDHYDVANRLWRKQVYKDVTKIGGIPTPVLVRVDDVQSGDWTEIKVSDVSYDAKVPDEIFDPSKLRELAANPVWVAKN